MIEPQRPVSKITVEDLLRLKRAERPAPEFWMQFERSLRAKQLAAIVEKRPWWSTWRGMARWSLPLSAAAALTVTVGVVTKSHREAARSSVALEKIATSASPRSAANRETEARISQADSEKINVAPIALRTAVATANNPVKDATVAPAEVASVPTVEAREIPTAPVPVSVKASAVQLGTVSEQIAGIDERQADGFATTSFTSADQSTGNSLMNTVGAFFDKTSARFGDLAHSDQPASVDPLAQVSTPRDARRARLLAYMGSSDARTPRYADTSSAARGHDRISSRLSDEAIYDSIHRFGMRDGGVSIQF